MIQCIPWILTVILVLGSLFFGSFSVSLPPLTEKINLFFPKQVIWRKFDLHTVPQRFFKVMLKCHKLVHCFEWIIPLWRCDCSFKLSIRKLSMTQLNATSEGERFTGEIIAGGRYWKGPFFFSGNVFFWASFCYSEEFIRIKRASSADGQFSHWSFSPSLQVYAKHCFTSVPKFLWKPWYLENEVCYSFLHRGSFLKGSLKNAKRLMIIFLEKFWTVYIEHFFIQMKLNQIKVKCISRVISSS